MVPTHGLSLSQNGGDARATKYLVFRASDSYGTYALTLMIRATLVRLIQSPAEHSRISSQPERATKVSLT